MTDLSPTKLGELKRLAEAIDYEFPTVRDVLAFEAAFEPPTVLALIAEVSRLTAELAESHEQIKRNLACMDEAKAFVVASDARREEYLARADTLAAELAEVRAERDALGATTATLSPEAFAAFMDMCDNPPPPTEALKELFRKYRENVGETDEEKVSRLTAELAEVRAERDDATAFSGSLISAVLEHCGVDDPPDHDAEVTIADLQSLLDEHNAEFDRCDEAKRAEKQSADTLAAENEKLWTVAKAVQAYMTAVDGAALAVVESALAALSSGEQTS